MKTTNLPTKPSPSTRDAWLLLCLAATLYVGSQFVFPNISIVWGTAAGLVLCFLLPSILFAKWKTSSAKEALRLRPVSGAIMLHVALLALTGVGAASLIEQATHPLIARYFGEWIPMLEALWELLTPKTLQALAGSIFVIGIISPVCEEVFFRGAFQGTLEQRGPVRAITLSAVMFGLMHMNPFNFIGPILFGLALGFVVWRTGSILPAILWHALNNSAAVLLIYFGGPEFAPPWWLNGGLAAIFGLLLWNFIRHTRAAALPLSPLATAPAMMRVGALRLVVAGGCGCVLLLIAGLTCFGRTVLGHDRFSPDYAAEDLVFYSRDIIRTHLQIRANDIVCWKSAKCQRSHFERVVKMKGDRLTLGIKPTNGAPYEVQIERSQVMGKIVWKLDPGEEVKQLMRGIKAKHPEVPEGNKN